jgi:hypothetical protein
MQLLYRFSALKFINNYKVMYNLKDIILIQKTYFFINNFIFINLT